MTIAERQDANRQYPGASLVIASSTGATYHPIPAGWQGKFVEVTGVGTVVRMRTDPAYVAVAATASTVASDLDADGLLASGGASAASAQVIIGAACNGVIDETNISPARRVSMAFSSHADWDATTAVVTGTDPVTGETITDTIAIPNGGNQTVSTAKLFGSVTSIAIPAQSGAGGTFTVGVLSSNAVTPTGAEPHVVVPDGQTRRFRIKRGDRFFNHIEATGSQTLMIALATGAEE
jgi:hypothetical protein